MLEQQLYNNGENTDVILKILASDVIVVRTYTFFFYFLCSVEILFTYNNIDWNMMCVNLITRSLPLPNRLKIYFIDEENMMIFRVVTQKTLLELIMCLCGCLGE
jgi:hypothetical protein